MEKIMYGHIVEIQLYNDLLQEMGIECVVQNEFEQAAHAGFGSGLPGNADLLVDEQDVERAQKIIEDFKASQEEK
jgi:hypothetical protein